MVKKTDKKEEKGTNLIEVMALWLYTSKKKNEYLFGTAKADTSLDEVFPVTGFFNTKKKKTKEPDVKIYESVAEDDSLGDPIAVLWNNTSKDGNSYASGQDNEGKKIIAFYGKKEENKRPYLRVYYSE